MPDRVKEKLVELLAKYFDIGDSYSYNLIRDKQAFMCGTMGFDDFEEFDEETVADIADCLIANGVTITPVKIGDTVYTNLAMQGWYLRKKGKPYSAKVVFIGLNDSEEMGGGLFNVVYDNGEHMWQFNFSDIGKTVFLNKEEAEAILSESQ